jgi:hypothetical protein
MGMDYVNSRFAEGEIVSTRIVSERLFHGDYLRGCHFREDCRKQIISGKFPQGGCLMEECAREIIKGKLLIEVLIFSLHMRSEAQSMNSKLRSKPDMKLFNYRLSRLGSGFS